VGAVVLHSGISLDGFFEGEDADISWHRVDDELHQHMNDVLRPAAAFLEGRVTYELMESVWPTMDADPATTPVQAEFAGIWRAVPKVVYSRTLRAVGPNATLERDVVPDDVRALAARSDGDLVVGGAVLSARFLELGLVDEFRIYVHPVVVGGGRRLFGEGSPLTGLRLAGTHTFGNGVVLLHHVRE
jgi:dihydrofolate reductase